MIRAAFLAAVCAALAPGAEPVRTLADMEPALTRIASFEDGQDRKPLVEFTGFVGDSLASPARLKEIEQRLLRLLQSSATRGGKDFALRQLSMIGTDASVSVLAGMLAEKDTGEMARYALARIPGTAATAALRRSLPQASGTMKIAIINSLGQRRDKASVPALTSMMSGKDLLLAESAASALARIADRPALEALSAARNKVPAALRPHIMEAYLQCADQMAADGDKAAALKAYKELLGADPPEMIRIRALGGLAGAAGKDAVPTLTAALESESPKLQATGIRLLNRIPGQEITRLLVNAFPELTPTAQARLLAALAERGDATAWPLVSSAAHHQSTQVRVAALEGLSNIAEASALDLLIETAANRGGVEQAAARKSLYRIRGVYVDSAIVSAMGAASGGKQAELIAAAGERGITSAAGKLLDGANSNDPEVRRASFRALRNAGGPAHVPAILELLAKATDSTDRREAARTLAVLMRDAAPAETRALRDAYQSASSVDVRTSLLEVMGQAPSEEALPLLRASLGDPNSEISRAAVLALSDWNSPAPMPDLLAIAKSGENPTLQVLALRGYIKLAAIPTNRSDPETAKLLTEAMRLATRPDEKRAILAALPAFPCQESLNLANEYVNDSAVTKEAKVAADRLSAALKQRQ